MEMEELNQSFGLMEVFMQENGFHLQLSCSSSERYLDLFPILLFCYLQLIFFCLTQVYIIWLCLNWNSIDFILMLLIPLFIFFSFISSSSYISLCFLCFGLYSTCMALYTFHFNLIVDAARHKRVQCIPGFIEIWIPLLTCIQHWRIQTHFQKSLHTYVA